MSFNLLRVSVFGRTDEEWASSVRLSSSAHFEEDAFDLRLHADDEDIAGVLAEERPQVILSFGDIGNFPGLRLMPIAQRRRWIHFDNDGPEPDDLAHRIMSCYVHDVTQERFADEPLVSVYTPTYLTGDKIIRPLRSLQSQTYRNWEWVIYDDSPDDGATFAQMSELAREDHRISVFRADRASGNIGLVKRRACGVANGAILVELDHDDELTPECLNWIVNAHRTFPDAGFFYTDCAEIHEDGTNHTYGGPWGMGFGSYRQEEWAGHVFDVTNYPEINAKTLRHIVGVPNHVRAWTRDAYWACGGHHPDVHVCDDYELLLRTFLATRMVHIRRFGYLQYMNSSSSGNTHRTRNREIQRLVRWFRGAYDRRIHERLLELGVEDWVWRGDNWLDLDAAPPDPVPIANYLFDGDKLITSAPGVRPPDATTGENLNQLKDRLLLAFTAD